MPLTTSKKPGCLASLFGFGRMSSPKDVQVTYLEADPEPDALPYHVRDDFLSPAEQSFYHVIKSMMGDHLAICPKVSLGDIFFVSRPHENRGAINRIRMKHIDFLICDPKTMKPLFALELDDSSHSRSDRVERDAFVDRVFEAAELPLIHIPVRATYNTSELGVLFKQALKNMRAQEAVVEPPQTLSAAHSPSSMPVCPKCGAAMVLRTAKQGDSAGKQFYGCPNYPKCREIVPV